MPARPCACVDIIHFAGASMHRRSLSQTLFNAIKSSGQSQPARWNSEIGLSHAPVAELARGWFHVSLRRGAGGELENAPEFHGPATGRCKGRGQKSRERGQSRYD
jgi:hypothetical protein